MLCLHTEEAKIGPQVQERDFSRVSQRESRLSTEISRVLKYRIVKFSTKRVGKQQVQRDDLLGDNRDSVLLQHDTMPDACSVSGNGSSTKDPCGQAEEPRSGCQVEAGPQPSAESKRYLKKRKETPGYINDCVTDSDESSIYGDQVLYSVDYCYKLYAFP